MRALAQLDNVVVKLGGLQMPVNGFGFGPPAAARPPTSSEIAAQTFDFYAFVIRVFGPRRCMFESNFPVDRWGTSYRALWNAFKRIAWDVRLGLSDEDRDALFHGTAKRVYNICGGAGEGAGGEE